MRGRNYLEGIRRTGKVRKISQLLPTALGRQAFEDSKAAEQLDRVLEKLKQKQEVGQPVSPQSRLGGSSGTVVTEISAGGEVSLNHGRCPRSSAVDKLIIDFLAAQGVFGDDKHPDLPPATETLAATGDEIPWLSGKQPGVRQISSGFEVQPLTPDLTEPMSASGLAALDFWAVSLAKFDLEI